MEDQIFHVMSRVVDKRMIFGDSEKSLFHRIMRQMEGFSGCEVLTYCLMGNHFHILLRVPKKPDDMLAGEVVRRLGWIYPTDRVKAISSKLNQLLKNGETEKHAALIHKYKNRMFDLSEFVKGLKQRFTQSYNLRNERKGTLWEERFKSLLIDPKQRSLLVVASYIDKNPLRAGLVKNAEEYRWSGYGEARRGEPKAQKGIAFIIEGFNRRKNLVRSLHAYGMIFDNELKESNPEWIDDNSGNLEGVHSHPRERLSNGIILGAQEFIRNCLEKPSYAGPTNYLNKFLSGTGLEERRVGRFFTLTKSKRKIVDNSENGQSLCNKYW